MPTRRTDAKLITSVRDSYQQRAAKRPTTGPGLPMNIHGRHAPTPCHRSSFWAAITLPGSASHGCL